MTIVFHQASVAEFLALVPVLRGTPGPVTVVAPWSRAHLAGRLIGASPMDIEMFEFTRLHAAGGPTRVSPAVAELFSGARHILSFVSDGRDAWSVNVARLAPQAELLFLEPRPRNSEDRHITDWLAEAVRQSGLTVEPREAEPDGKPAGPLLIHPGSTAPAKCWPRERYAQLIQSLRDAGRSVCPVLGEVELQRWPAEVVQRWQAEYCTVICKTTDVLADAIASSSEFLGNDAAPAQLASQLGVPALTLFGPSSPQRWAPRGPGCRPLAPPDGPATMDWLGVEQVLAALDGSTGTKMK